LSQVGKGSRDLDGSRSTRLKQVSHTRWLSFEGSIQAVVDNFQNVVAVMFKENSAK
jgi:hypothetical protein